MKTFLEKLKSRKFLTALAGIITGVALIFGADQSAITAVSGAVTALASVLTYIITEGKIDAAAVSGAATAVQQAADVIKKEGDK